MTINKSQGQTLSKVSVDLTTPLFSHEQFSIFSGISSLFRRTKRVEELGNEIIRDDSTIVSGTEENESSLVNQRKRKYDFTNDKKLECSDIRKNIKSMLNCKYKYDYIVSACFHTFGSKSNIGASYTIIGKDFVFTSSCRLRKNTTDNFIIAKILHDGIVEACEKFPHAKLLVFGDNPVYQNFLKKREEDENFVDSIKSHRIKKLITKIVMLEFKHDITFDEIGSTFVQRVLKISSKGESTVKCFSKYNSFLTSYECYKRYMHDNIL
uniref:ATP-dependent DNA helicase n=1 Tax=Strongyloides venezuelensis TaxID=75913 RepID=A0A0K0F0N8_STRVS